MTRETHFQSVHMLRGIAACLVACDHLLGQVPYLAWLDSVGDLGVVCFFVISGFAISHSLGNEYEIKDLARFLARRLIRIEPTYLASVAIYCAFFAVLTRIAPRAIPWSPAEGQLLSHALYLVPFTGAEWFAPAYWSLAVEFQFYLVIGFLYPALLRMERRWKNGIVVCMIMFAMLAFLSPYCMPVGLLEYSPFFALGILLDRGLSKPGNRGPMWAAAFVLCAIAFLAGSGTGDGPAWAGLATFAIIYFWPPDLRLTSRVARTGLFLGTISYSWYVIHTVVGIAGETGSRFVLRQDAFPFQQVLVNLVPAATFVASIFAAWLLYVAIERPTHRLARKIALRPDRSS